MKRYSHWFYLLLVLPWLFTACGNDDDPMPEPEIPGKYSTGFFIINEGNFTDGDGSISFYDTEQNTPIQDIFKAENGFAVGGIIQNMKIHNGKAFLMTNRASQLIVVDVKTFREEANLEGLIDPFDFAAVGTKGYVSVWGDPGGDFSYASSSIAVLDVNTYQVTRSIPVGQRVAGMLAQNNKIYAAVEGGREILVIDPNTDQILTRIETPNGPSKLLMDNNNRIWAICTSGALVQIDPASDQIIKTITGISVSGYNESFVHQGGILYWIANDFFAGTRAIYSLGVQASTPPANPLITPNYSPYGLGVSPDGSVLYVAEGNFSVTEGRVFTYSTSGMARGDFATGRAPSGFVFQ